MKNDRNAQMAAADMGIACAKQTDMQKMKGGLKQLSKQQQQQQKQ